MRTEPENTADEKIPLLFLKRKLNERLEEIMLAAESLWQNAVDERQTWQRLRQNYVEHHHEPSPERPFYENAYPLTAESSKRHSSLINTPL